MCDTQGDITCNPETITHTINGNEIVTHTSNGNIEQKTLSNRTIPVLPLAVNPWIDQGIAPIVSVPQTLLAPVTKEVVAETASDGAGLTGLCGK